LSFRYRQQYFSYDPVFENYSIEREVLHLRFALKAYDTRADSQHRISYLLTRSGNGLSGQFAPSWEQPQQVSLTRIAERSQTQEEGTLPAPSSRPVPVTGNNAAQSVQTVTPTSDAPTRVDCSSERSLRAGTGEATKIQFVNRSSQSIGIVWLNQNGARVLYKTLNSGESYLQDTFLTHPWVITNFAGECQAIYMPTRGTSTVEYQAPLAAKKARENESRRITLFSSPEVTIFYQDLGTDVFIDITGPNVAFPMIKVDVNQNGQIDPNVDTYYTIFRDGLSPCNGYLVRENAITGCGTLVSKSTLGVNPSEKSFHWVIPKTELSTAGGSASLIIELSDLKLMTRLSYPSASFSNSFRLTFVAAN
jgi:hypothetical protein